jgi:hypothetical protein
VQKEHPFLLVLGGAKCSRSFEASKEMGVLMFVLFLDGALELFLDGALEWFNLE